VIQNSAATFKRVIGNTAISLQPRYLDYFDNDRFDLDGVKTKTAGGFGSGMILRQLQKKGSFTGCKWNRQL
jgi:hypothetical protein